MMNNDAHNIISRWSDSIDNKVDLELVINNSKTSETFIHFCNKLSGSAPNVNIKTIKDGDITEPFIKINDNLSFKAIPEEKMLKVFLDILTFKNTAVSEKILNHLTNFNLPVKLKIYISSFCPFCPKVLSDVAQLAFTKKNIQIIVVDAGLFPELAKEDKVISAPTVIYNEHFRWTGTVKPEDIAEVIGNIIPESLSSSALRTILETGKASVLADMMTDAGVIFPSFYEIITHEKWPVRLGAMVVMEELIETAPSLAELVIAKLWKQFETYENSVKGDIIYLTGETGNSNYLKKVNDIIIGEYPEELKEAAEEAVENLK